MSNLSCSEYSKTKVVVEGDDCKKYVKEMRGIGARWNSRLRQGRKGWMIPIERYEFNCFVIVCVTCSGVSFFQRIYQKVKNS